jgi:PPM family protein phosphatase
MDDDSELDTVELPLPPGADSLDMPARFSALVRVDLGALSHVGKVRPNNEDSYLVFRTGRYWERLLTNLPAGELPARHEENAYVMAVADGLGGAEAGEVASSLALRTGVAQVLRASRWALKLDHPEDREREVREGIERGLSYFRKMHEAVSRRAEGDPALAGMGTTLTASYSVGDDLFVFHVGDSRAYLSRAGALRRLTHDHTMAQALADAGVISQAEVGRHRLRCVLTRAIGGAWGRLEAEVQQLRLVDGDQLLLCSDGLTGMVEDGAIAEVLRRAESSESACRALVDLALGRGGKDNVTVLLARYAIPERPASPPA